MNESDVVFIRDTEKESTNIKEDYVKFVNRTGGVVEVNIRAPREDLTDTYAFFSGVNDMEGIGMDIAGSGARWNHYFRGISELTEEEDGTGYKFKVTLQIRDAAPR
ncbi:MAG: hypothetical protein ACXVHT_10310 [Methanobacterium sp.]